MAKHPNLGQQLRRLRLQEGLTQREACRAIWGTEERQSLWSRWETGNQRPNLGSLTEIAEFFGVPLNHFGLDLKAKSDIEKAERMIERARDLLVAAEAMISRATV